ncbi:MAG: hypothetical protein NTX64_11410 [Elusimicrobia bacterium]|nr:hypothetical protein [Elusimicrobiota bacterium]
MQERVWFAFLVGAGAVLCASANAAERPFRLASPIAQISAPFSGQATAANDAFAEWMKDGAGISAAVETDDLARLDNDNDGKPSMFSVRTQSDGRGISLVYGPLDGSRPRVVPFDDSLRRCSVQGADRLDKQNNCGVEIEAATGGTSAVRILIPDLDVTRGGHLTIMYLKHYSIIGSNDEAEVDFDVKRVNSLWGLYLPGTDKRVRGLFLHRAGRGIGLIIACVGSSCPAEWARRDKAQNDDLPAVWPTN